VAQKKGNMVPLDRTGALREGMKDIGLWTISRQTAFIADLPQSIWYGKVHQAGYGGHDVQDEYEYPGGHRSDPVLVGTRNYGAAGSIPPRPFVMLQPSDELLIEEVFDIWIEEQIIRAGLR
jgi:valyl-tRNA synthetase